MSTAQCILPSPPVPLSPLPSTALAFSTRLISERLFPRIIVSDVCVLCFVQYICVETNFVDFEELWVFFFDDFCAE